MCWSWGKSNSVLVFFVFCSQGEVEHADSEGNRGIIGPGDVQWMTAASGIIHEEFHSTNFAKEGGVFEMVQLWVNLPAEHKMSPPSYQPILASSIPSVALPSSAGSVSVIAGAFAGVAGPARTFTPINMWTVTLKAGRAMTAPIPAGHTTVVFVRSGAVTTAGDGGGEGKARIVQGQISVFSREGESCELEAGEEGDAEVVVLSGMPIEEEIAARGPFVMNTKAELREAMEDYSSGRMGKHFKSTGR
mmetsp:Transcript_18501/g.46458  ORF Transcript_18501/g.46458 Transcript_18501/m.46458 type:complete len:247 (-) Transcript_18501:148-888(-)